MQEIPIKTRAREEMVDITREVGSLVAASGVCDGMCHLNCLHTTAGITINENADPDVKADILMALRNIVQDSWPYAHAEGNSPAHIKSSIVGASLAIPVSRGRLVLGTWQGIVFCEFDGPRSRQVTVTVTGA
jgi:secondary thiamine-phosphate synthase enzyme